jgi:hypothetical protein
MLMLIRVVNSSDDSFCMLSSVPADFRWWLCMSAPFFQARRIAMMSQKSFGFMAAP